MFLWVFFTCVFVFFQIVYFVDGQLVGSDLGAVTCRIWVKIQVGGLLDLGKCEVFFGGKMLRTKGRFVETGDYSQNRVDTKFYSTFQEP